MKKILAICFLLSCITISLFADTIVLKSGKHIEGTVLERTNDSIKVDISGATLTYYLDEVATINSETVSPSQKVTATPEAVTPPSIEPQSASNESQAPAAAGVSGTPAESDGENAPVIGDKSAEINQKNRVQKSSDFGVIENKQGSPDSTFEQEIIKLFKQGDPLKGIVSGLINNNGSTIAAALITVVIIALIFWVFMYVYGGICLYLISKKTGRGVSILAWIPIANLFLMCKIAGLSYLWLLALLVIFIPFLGSLLIVAGFTYLWYKIAEARGKPGWLGILTIIPLANLVIMGYLAFSE